MEKINNNIVDLIDVEPHHLEMVQSVLSRHVPYKVVWAYGSRVKWTATERSDLDIVVFNASDRELGNLKDAFDESEIPFIVQVLNWESIPDDFKENIKQKYYILQTEKSWGTFTLGDVIIIARTGATIGANKFIDADLNSVFNNGLIRIKVDRDIGYSKYIYYILRSNNYLGFIENISGGTSTQPNMQINVLLSYEIQLPPLPEQKAIGEVLSSLDDKIDLLHRQNKTLESLAETLFRHHFIENAQDDWEEKQLDDIKELQSQANSGVQVNLTTQSIKDSEFLIPPIEKQKEVLHMFEEIFCKLDANTKQIQTLEKLRDTLLPKLISGDVRVEYKEVA